MLAFILDFLRLPFGRSLGKTVKLRIVQAALCWMALLSPGLTQADIYETAGSGGWTSERLPRRNLSTMSPYSSALYKHSNTSLRQNQHVCTCSGSGSASKTNRQFIICRAVCVRPGGRRVFVTAGSFTTSSASLRD